MLGYIPNRRGRTGEHQRSLPVLYKSTLRSHILQAASNLNHPNMAPMATMIAACKVCLCILKKVAFRLPPYTVGIFQQSGPVLWTVRARPGSIPNRRDMLVLAYRSTVLIPVQTSLSTLMSCADILKHSTDAP